MKYVAIACVVVCCLYFAEANALAQCTSGSCSTFAADDDGTCNGGECIAADGGSHFVSRGPVRRFFSNRQPVRRAIHFVIRRRR